MPTINLPRDPIEISGWLRIDDRLTTSGQPTEVQLAALKTHGIDHVVNLALHTHDKALQDETASVQALGMTYVHLPVDFSAPTEADLRTFYRIMEECRGSTVHVHCIANMRVSAFLYRYHRERMGMPEREARAFMDQVWRPGGVWAAFIGDSNREDRPHQLAGRDYQSGPDPEHRRA